MIANIVAWTFAVVFSVVWMVCLILPCCMAFDNPSPDNWQLPLIVGAIYFGPPLVTIIIAIACTAKGIK